MTDTFEISEASSLNIIREHNVNVIKDKIHEAENNNLKKQFKRLLQQQLQVKDKQIENLTQQLQSQNKQIENLTQQLQSQNKQIENLTQQLFELQKQQHQTFNSH